MLLQLVVAAHRFLFSTLLMKVLSKGCLRALLVGFCFATSNNLWADVAAEEAVTMSHPIKPAILDINYPTNSKGRLANIQDHSLEELTQLLDRAGESLEEGVGFPAGNAVVFILHGPEVHFFKKENFSQYRALVEKAAQLEAFDLIDVQVCELYLAEHGISRSQLPAFVNSVPNGPREEARLIEREGYVHF